MSTSNLQLGLSRYRYVYCLVCPIEKFGFETPTEFSHGKLWSRMVEDKLFQVYGLQTVKLVDWLAC